MSRSISAARSWFATPPPAVAIEIAATRVAAVVLSAHGGRLVVAAHAVEPVGHGVVSPSLNAANVLDEDALQGALGAALDRLGQRPRRVGLVLPDATAKVSLIRFDKVPERAQDLEQLIRWQVRKTAPFRIEDAQVSWHPAARGSDGGREYLVCLARRDIVRAYERACEAAGLHPGLVDIASLSQINAILAGEPPAGDWLLMSVAADHATLAVVRGDDVVFFRSRSTASEGDLPDLVHQTAMYHEDRLGGGGFARVVLCGVAALGAGEAVRLAASVGERIGVPVSPIDIRPAVGFGDRISAGPELLDVLAGPVGLLVREWAPARDRRAS
jgi:type IV pilus assembly protein PilM